MAQDEGPENFTASRIGLIYAPWEKGFERIVFPFERFVRHQATAGIILMATALAALILANTQFAGVYQKLLHLSAGISIENLSLQKSLHHWVNDGLMTLFFFMVGLELKREILVGELANPRIAALPIAAAIGGMIVPAFIFTAVAWQGDAVHGWGIPMATDIAFALGVIALLSRRVPKSLITFLVALAIVDDLGAVLIIAFFYTDTLVPEYLLVSALVVLMMVVMNLLGIRRAVIYFLLATLLWLTMLKSGVHATLAGVITAFTIPALPRYDPDAFSLRMQQLLKKFDDSYSSGQSILKNQQMAAIVHSLEQGVRGVEPPLQRLEHLLHKPVAFFVLPLFAFFNAGIALNLSDFPTSFQQPVTLGVSLGLLLGKFIGIAGFSWLALRLGVATLPRDVSMQHIFGAALLGGIGFTMSIFITELAFAHEPELILHAKQGILFASVTAGVLGYGWLYYLGAERKD